MRQIFSLILFLTVVGTTTHAQVEPKNFSYMDIFDLQMVANPQISPDGERVIYEKHQFDVMTDKRMSNLWIIDVDGSNHQALTSGNQNAGSVHWHPDGDRFLYVSSEEGSAQLFVYWLESGRKASITNLSRSPGQVQWSPDGSQIVFTMFVPEASSSIGNIPTPPKGATWEEGARYIDNAVYRYDGRGYLEEGHQQIFVVSPEGGAPIQLTEFPTDHSNVSWAPEGQHVLFTANFSENREMDPNNEQIYSLELSTGERTTLTNNRGPHNQPKMSPNGELIAFTGYEDQFVGYQQSELYIMNAAGSQERVISESIDLDIGAIHWDDNSEGLYVGYTEKGVAKIGYVNLNGTLEVLATHLGSPTLGRPYAGGSFSVTGRGDFAFSSVTAQRPTQLSVGSHKGRSSVNTLTSYNDEFFSSTQVGEVNEFWVSSSVDDFKVHGWIITPPNFDPSKSYPLILEIHGGPYSAYGPQFSPELQFMASQGYVVVYTNPRGSTSYGEDFAAYINGNYPSEDYNDLMDAVDYVVDQGYIDTDRLFITGGSGGGVLTAWAIGKTDRFRAAVVAKPVINWYSFVLNADNVPFFSKYWFTKKPWEDPDQYLKLSPISLVGNVTTPTMLLTGEQDYRTPMSETEQYYGALKLQGVESAMVRIQGSSHGIAAKPSNLFRKVAYITGWFEAHSQDALGGQEN